MQCFVCKTPTRQVCGHCGLFPYCSVKCQEQDWKYHAIQEHAPQGNDDLNRVYVNAETHGELWIGGIEALPLLDQYHIDAVVSVLHHRSRPVNEQRMAQMIDAPRRAHKRYYYYDDEAEPIHKVFEESARFIHQHMQQGHRVLVHCYGGISRSVTLAINYLLTYYPKQFTNVQDTLAYIRQNRPQANPNSGFIRQLVERGK